MANKVVVYICFQELRLSKFSGFAGFSDSEVQRFAASSIETEDSNSSLAQLETSGRLSDQKQRPLVELNRNSKCFDKNRSAVNSAFKVTDSFSSLTLSLSVVVIFGNLFSATNTLTVTTSSWRWNWTEPETFGNSSPVKNKMLRVEKISQEETFFKVTKWWKVFLHPMIFMIFSWTQKFKIPDKDQSWHYLNFAIKYNSENLILVSHSIS